MFSTRIPEARSFINVAFICASAMVFPSLAAAQSTGAVSGLVTDSAGIPVIGAIVSASGTRAVTTSNYRGEFHFPALIPGPTELRARRLGFRPSARTIQVGAQQSQQPVHIILSFLPTNVEPVIVEARHVEYSGRLAGYYERLHRRSGGQFIDREAIERQSSRSLSQLLARMPGINSVSFRTGQDGVRMRGRACRPLVWLDGVPMPAGEVDLNAFPTSTLHGIELYLGSTSAPFDYVASQGMSSCGTILLWSRGRDTEAAEQVRPRLVNLEQLADSMAIFTADQVDVPAKPVSPNPLLVAYPASLFAGGIAGTAIAEFVVDQKGLIEAETFSIVSTSHALFAEAVSRALKGAIYSPALKAGASVRQVIQQRFEFSPSGKATKVSTLHGR